MAINLEKEAKFPIIKIEPNLDKGFSIVEFTLEKDQLIGKYISPFTYAINQMKVIGQKDSKVMRINIDLIIDFLKKSYPLIQNLINNSDSGICDKGLWLGRKFQQLNKDVSKFVKSKGLSTEQIDVLKFNI